MIIASRLSTPPDGYRKIAISINSSDNDTALLADDLRLLSLPKEIREGSFKDALAYVDDLKLNGGEASYRIKLLLAGHQAVGKTSLLNCLMPLAAIFEDDTQRQWMISLHGPLLTLVCPDDPSLTGAIQLNVNYTTDVPDAADRTIVLQVPQCPDKLALHRHFRFVKPLNNVPRPHLPLSILPMNIHLAFDSEIIGAWRQQIEHFTNNDATHGIDTRTLLDTPEGAPPLQMRCMDFPGQGEFVFPYDYCTFSSYDFFFQVSQLLEPFYW
jgi:hypothetical protein